MQCGPPCGTGFPHKSSLTVISWSCGVREFSNKTRWVACILLTSESIVCIVTLHIGGCAEASSKLPGSQPSEVRGPVLFLLLKLLASYVS